jgi:hypothetical protein
MNAPVLCDWTGANRKYVAAEFARLRALLGEGELKQAETEVERRRAMMPTPPAVDALTGLFGLSGFERDLLLLAAGVEMDARLADLCARSGRGLTFGLALATLPDAHWSALAPVEPLRRWRLVDLDEAPGLTQGRLRADERILHFVAGLSYTDSHLGPLLREVEPPRLMDAGHRAATEGTAKALAEAPGMLPTLLLDGDDAEGQRDAAALVAGTLCLTLFAMSASDVPALAREQEALATLWQREALLTGAGLLIEAGDERGAAVTRFAERIDGFLAISGQARPPRDRPSIRLRLDRPDASGQRELWSAALGARADELAPLVEALAGQHRLSARRIAEAADGIAGVAPEDAARRLRALPHTRAPRLDGLAQEIVPKAGWDDIVLPGAQRRTLSQISVHVRLRNRVHEDWGFAGKSGRGLGLATLFWGDSGTGKTLAAEVLARELDLPLYRIDLSAVVSKYIGETEKNLARVFDAAEEDGAILLFDEADALFGKRSEVKDSHDRYANIEVSYLLQRMEAYRGLAILTTNLKDALDTAFLRRLRFIVQFPFPDAAQRADIWRRIFPGETPTEGLDAGKLARLSVTGGNIRNIALAAAFLAADEGAPVRMAHLLRAARGELAKIERPLSESEVRGWVE